MLRLGFFALVAAGGCSKSPCSGVKGACVELAVAPALTAHRLELTFTAVGVLEPRYDVGGDGRTLSLPTTIPLLFDTLSQPTQIQLAVDAVRAGGHVARGTTEFSLAPMEHKRVSVTLELDMAGNGSDGVDGGNDDMVAPLDGTDGGASCPAGMVLIQGPSSFCIDATEVTVAAYRKFLAVPMSSLTVPPLCQDVTSFAPNGGTAECNTQLAGDKEQYPIACVDWCSAAVYCTWAGKRLCGALGGGQSLLPSAARDPMKSEWMYACAKGGTQKYPYGETFDGNACNGYEYASTAHSRIVGSLPGCVGGFPGLFDMAGNLGEWVNSQDTDNNTVVLGGAFDGYMVECGSFNPASMKDQREIRYGFRCCK